MFQSATLTGDEKSFSDMFRFGVSVRNEMKSEKRQFGWNS